MTPLLRKTLLCASVFALLLCPAIVNCGDSDDDNKNGGAAGGDGGGSSSGVVLTGPPGQIVTWTAPAGRKVQPSTAAGTANAITVSSVRDAYVGAQLAVRGNAGYLKGVTAAVSGDLSDGAGHTLAASEIALFRAHVVDFAGVPAETIVGNTPVPANSPTQDTHVGDPLVPLVDPETKANVGQPFDVVGGTNVALFVDVHVPKGLAAGTYTGKVHIDAGAVGGATDVPISVTVLGLDLPDMRTVTTHFKLSINELINYHGGISACSGADCYIDINKPETRKLIKRYEELAHAHRIDIGQSLVFLPVNACVPPTDGDWAAYDSALQPYLDGSYFADGVGSSFYDLPFSPGQTFGVDQDCDEAGYKALATAWVNHLKSKGWFPAPPGGGFGATVYAFDEPMAAGGDLQAVLTKIERDSSWLQSTLPGDPSPWKSRIIDTVAPIAKPDQPPATTPQLDPALGVYVVNLPQYGAGFQPFYGKAEWQSSPGLMKQGISLWFYESNSVPPPYPTFSTNTLDANEPVVMMWGSWFEKATGFLYWDISAWDEQNPWGPNSRYGKTGDGVLIYPGNHNGAKTPAGSPGDVNYDGPIGSYRLKMIRQGLQDWALFKYADSKGLTAAVTEQVQKVYHQMGGTTPAPAGSPYWTTDDAAMDAARQAVVTAILAK